MEQYTIQQDDTWTSICEKFRVPFVSLQQVNLLTRVPVPGEIIAIPVQNQELHPQSATFQVHYCTRNGDVKGVLTVNSKLIIFDPHVQDKIYCLIHSTKETTQAPALKYTACIDMRDLVKCTLIELPTFTSSTITEDSSRIFFIELGILHAVSSTGIAIPKLNTFFRLSNVSNIGFPMTYNEQKANADRLHELLTYYKQHIQDEQSQSSTNIPFYDVNKMFLQNSNEIPSFAGMRYSNSIDEFLQDEEEYKRLQGYDNELEDIEQELAQQQPAYANLLPPDMTEKSEILTPEMAAQITAHLPVIYQFNTWELAYSPARNGSSLQVFYRQNEQVGANVLVVKDDQGYIFGGFATEG